MGLYECKHTRGEVSSIHEHDFSDSDKRWIHGHFLIFLLLFFFFSVYVVFFDSNHDQDTRTRLYTIPRESDGDIDPGHIDS